MLLIAQPHWADPPGCQPARALWDFVPCSLVGRPHMWGSPNRGGLVGGGGARPPGVAMVLLFPSCSSHHDIMLKAIHSATEQSIFFNW